MNYYNFALKGFTLISSILILINSHVAAEPIKIGVIIPLSGPLATFGVALKNAIEIAQAEQDPLTQTKIKFLYEDSQYDGKIAISAFNKLNASDKVHLIFAWGTTPAIALAPITNQNKLPLITLSGAEEVAADRPYVIDFVGRISDFSKATLDHIRLKGFKKIGVIKMETQYIEALSKGMEENLLPEESIKTIASFPPENNFDFNTAIAKLKNSIQKNEFDAIGVFIGSGPLSTFYQKMSQHGISIPTFGTDYFGDEIEMKKAGKPAVGSFFATLKVSNKFTQIYTPKFGNTAISYAANAYDFTKILFQIIQNEENSITSEQILEKFENVRNYSGACGSYTFVIEDSKKLKNPGKRFTSEIAIKEIIEGGAAVEVIRVD